ncbi:hypothetical protein BDW71DRAFT_181979 [Aspergillus fruticulosus]
MRYHRVLRHDLRTMYAAFAPGPVAGVSLSLVTGRKLEIMVRIIGCEGNCGSCRSPNIRGPCLIRAIAAVAGAVAARLGFHLADFFRQGFSFSSF